MVKLCLGSANFGSKYGLDNKKINKEKLLKIINLANKNKLLNIDTSFEYSGSHLKLKKISSKKLTINTKIFFKKNQNYISIKKKILNFNKSSHSKIYSLLFHEQNDALNSRKVELLKKLKSDGLVSKIGVSVYDLSVLKKILNIWIPDIVQIPVNPFNRDFISKNFLSYLKKRKITIYARSIFLRGMLVKKSDILKSKFKKDLEDWFNFCENENIHPVKACIDFCKSMKEIDYIIIGVDDETELMQIIKFSKQNIKIKLNSIIKRKYRKIDLRKI